MQSNLTEFTSAHFLNTLNKLFTIPIHLCNILVTKSVFIWTLDRSLNCIKYLSPHCFNWKLTFWIVKNKFVQTYLFISGRWQGQDWAQVSRRLHGRYPDWKDRRELPSYLRREGKVNDENKLFCNVRLDWFQSFRLVQLDRKCFVLAAAVTKALVIHRFVNNSLVFGIHLEWFRWRLGSFSPSLYLHSFAACK